MPRLLYLKNKTKVDENHASNSVSWLEIPTSSGLSPNWKSGAYARKARGGYILYSFQKHCTQYIFNAYIAFEKSSVSPC